MPFGSRTIWSALSGSESRKDDKDSEEVEYGEIGKKVKEFCDALEADGYFKGIMATVGLDKGCAPLCQLASLVLAVCLQGAAIWVTRICIMEKMEETMLSGKSSQLIYIPWSHSGPWSISWSGEKDVTGLALLVGCLIFCAEALKEGKEVQESWALFLTINAKIDSRGQQMIILVLILAKTAFLFFLWEAGIQSLLWTTGNNLDVVQNCTALSFIWQLDDGLVDVFMWASWKEELKTVQDKLCKKMDEKKVENRPSSEPENQESSRFESPQLNLRRLEDSPAGFLRWIHWLPFLLFPLIQFDEVRSFLFGTTVALSVLALVLVVLLVIILFFLEMHFDHVSEKRKWTRTPMHLVLADGSELSTHVYFDPVHGSLLPSREPARVHPAPPDARFTTHPPPPQSRFGTSSILPFSSD